jgi:hypothetical protein
MTTLLEKYFALQSYSYYKELAAHCQESKAASPDG